jgi:hypothetical protein
MTLDAHAGPISVPHPSLERYEAAAIYFVR